MRTRLALAVLLVATPAAAAPREVTLDDVRAAADAAPERAAAHRRTLGAVADADAAGGWPATTVSLGTARSSPRLVAVASVPLPVFGVERAARATARAEADAVRADEGALAVDVREAATVAWLALYRAGQVAAIAAEGADRLAQLVDVAKARRAAGDASDADVVTAETQVARARVEADDATLAVDVAAADLAAVVGWDPAEELRAAGELPAGEPPALDAIAANLPDHPELRAQRARVDAADAAVDEARAARLPSLRLDLELDAFDPADAPTDVLVNLSVDLPLFGRGRARVDAARAHVDAEAAEADAVRARLGAELVAAHRRWAAAARRAASYGSTLVPAQETSTDLVRKAYQAGEVDLASVLQSERDLLDVRAEAVDAAIAAAEAWAALERAAGGSL